MAAAIIVPAGLTAGFKGPTVPADKALKLLREGNNRFVEGLNIHAHTSKTRRDEVVNGQEPFATIISCADSRVPVERVFDHGFGDLFVLRSAGNFFEGASLIGTAEYGVLHTGTKLIVVLGHQSCGAVGAGLAKNLSKTDENTSIPELVSILKPGIAIAKQTSLSGVALYKEAIEQNVFASIANLITKSPKISRAVSAKEVMIVGGVYSLESGRVEWLGRHPHEADLTITHVKPYEER